MAENCAAHGQKPHSNAPHATRKRRTIIACLPCRKRKLRCITFEQPPTNPCQRCARLNLACEYMSVNIAEALAESDPVQAPPASSLESTSAIAVPVDLSASHHSGNLAPRLPYTFPPPPGARPRYYGQSLPPLGAMEFGAGHPDLQFIGLGVNVGTGQFDPAEHVHVHASGYPPAVGYGMQTDGHRSYPHSYASGPREVDGVRA
ncbi:hypothetical protein FB45DRAFT_1029155 [Roridomyces roridus]|uniref:Zn(2)-C6 fungal-type domain-containing protein n=1 Tax=Roridomyces roridus TaxID=1738132 RepID=A0AAD7BSH5_9AGAR|nr:hypothetical protein FB45DRAFT_1029155 [Roridomyces roridus]